MYLNEEGHADFLPVDTAVNAALLATWNFISNK
jgi:hypothetical protein